MDRCAPRPLCMAIGAALFAVPVLAQDRAVTSPATLPVVILIQEGTEMPAQPLLRRPVGDDTIVSYAITGGATLADHEGRHATRPIRDPFVLVPALRATRPGDDGDLAVVVNGQPLRRSIRVATVTADHLREARRLVGADASPNSSDPLLDISPARGAMIGERATLRVTATYLIVDYARVDRTQWSDEGIAVTYGSGPNEPAQTATTCIRTPLGPGWIEWTVITDPRAGGHSVLPEASNTLVWARAPSQDADARYNQFWPPLTAIKIPDHCTDYPALGGCCCNYAASFVAGVCRLADFNGDERGWPREPLRQ